jgi:hypothetical protein
MSTCKPTRNTYRCRRDTVLRIDNVEPASASTHAWYTLAHSQSVMLFEAFTPVVNTCLPTGYGYPHGTTATKPSCGMRTLFVNGVNLKQQHLVSTRNMRPSNCIIVEAARE